MKRTLVPSLLAVLALLAAGSCGGKRGDGLSVSFDVEALPPAPPEPEPAFVPPPPPPPPVELGPSVADEATLISTVAESVFPNLSVTVNVAVVEDV